MATQEKPKNCQQQTRKFPKRGDNYYLDCLCAEFDDLPFVNILFASVFYFTQVTRSYLPSSWWKISASCSLSMLHPNTAIKPQEIITCRSATRLQGKVSAERPTEHRQAGQKCFCWLCWRCKTARWRWQFFKTPCMDGKCGKQTWKVTGSCTH